MHPFNILTILSLATSSTALVPQPLFERSIGSSCTTPDGAGTCQSTSDCVTTGFNLASYCPHDANDIQCCVKKSCTTPHGTGTCINTADSARIGDADSFSGGSFSAVYPAIALLREEEEEEEGALASWPRPSRKKVSPTSGAAEDATVLHPAASIVLVCLTQYALCTALALKIPRTAQTQYHSPLGTHLPRAAAEPGDLLFWGADGGDCVHSVAHVAVLVREGWMVNAAHTGTLVREQAVWESAGGEGICGDVVRFW
ncbi:MAG: hypothetical protein Q9202_006054 [Teloschistes flavicans]